MHSGVMCSASDGWGIRLSPNSEQSCYARIRPSLAGDKGSDCRSEGCGLEPTGDCLGAWAGPSTISLELRRTACPRGAYHPDVADRAHLLRRQCAAVLEQDTALAGDVTDRLIEGWTPEQIAGWLRHGTERGLYAVSAETICAWIARPGQTSEKPHISQRSDAADAPAEAGH